MPYGFVAGAILGSAYLSSEASEDAAHASLVAGERQAQSADRGVEEARRQFDQIQTLFKPYVEGGQRGFTGMLDMMGLNGADAQRASINSIMSGPEYASLVQQGEEAILANASATGGLRGGNTQSALGQFRPALLSQLISDRFSRLGGIAQLGQASAAGQASAGLQTGQTVADLYQQQGAAQAGGIIGAGQARAQGQMQIANSLSSLAGMAAYKKF